MSYVSRHPRNECPGCGGTEWPFDLDEPWGFAPVPLSITHDWCQWCAPVKPLLDEIGDAVLDALTWDWPTGATEWRWLPDAGKEFVLAMPETKALRDLSEKIHLLEPSSAFRWW